MVFFKKSDITVYNKYYDKVNDIDRYQKTIIRGANWQGKRNATVSDKGLNREDSILIFVDKLDNYVSPKRFARLTDDERANYFTFGLNDLVVKGEIDFEITGIKPNSIADLERQFDDVVNILGVSPWSEHWEVECK